MTPWQQIKWRWLGWTLSRPRVRWFPEVRWAQVRPQRLWSQWAERGRYRWNVCLRLGRGYVELRWRPLASEVLRFVLGSPGMP